MRKVPSSATTGPLGGAICSIESFSSTVVIPQSALATSARRVPDRRKRTQGSQESCSCFFHLQQIRAEKQHSNANGLAHTRNLSECEPGGQQRKGRIEGEQRTHQGSINLVQCNGRKKRCGPVERNGGEEGCHKAAINVWNPCCAGK